MFSKVEENREVEEVEKIDIPPFLSVAWGAHSPVRPAVGRHSRGPQVVSELRGREDDRRRAGGTEDEVPGAGFECGAGGVTKRGRRFRHSERSRGTWAGGGTTDVADTTTQPGPSTRRSG